MIRELSNLQTVGTNQIVNSERTVNHAPQGKKLTDYTTSKIKTFYGQLYYRNHS